MDLMNVFYLLDVVNILIGIVCLYDVDNYYMMYQIVINLIIRMLYIKYYGSNELVVLKFIDDLINRKDMMIFKFEKYIIIRKLNDN